MNEEDKMIAARDSDTGTPIYWHPGTGGRLKRWITRGWAEHQGPFACSRCDLRSCACECHLR